MLILSEHSSSSGEVNIIPKKTTGKSGKRDQPKHFRRRKPCVLILGTDAETRFLFRTALEFWNFEVTEVENAEQAIFVFEDKKPDIVLMDGERDLSSSYASVRKMREFDSFKTAPFVLISGHAQDYVRQTALAAGADGFLVKPIDFQLLESTLKTFCDEDGFY